MTTHPPFSGTGTSSTPLTKLAHMRRRAGNLRLMAMNLLTLGILFGVHSFIFPKVIGIMADMKAQLPPLTKQIMGIPTLRVQLLLELIAAVVVVKEFVVPSLAVKYLFNWMLWLALMALLVLLLAGMLLPMMQVLHVVAPS